MKSPSEPNRRFKGVWIPKNLWLCKKLSWLQKCVVAEIDSLSDDQNPCEASNSYLAMMFDVSRGRMANILSELRELGVLQVIAFDGKKRLLKITPPSTETVDSPLNGFREPPFTETVNPPFTETVNSPPPCNIYKGTSLGTSLGTTPIPPEGGAASNEIKVTELDIYAAYPLKVAKPKALVSIKKAMSKESPARLLEITKAYAARRAGDLAFVPHPATWFNQERYNDDPSTWARDSQTKPQGKKPDYKNGFAKV